jgi:hypothetical protein
MHGSSVHLSSHKGHLGFSTEAPTLLQYAGLQNVLYVHPIFCSLCRFLVVFMALRRTNF